MAGRVLDVGCGSGLIGYTAIRDVVGATTVSIDSVPVLEVADDLAHRMGIADRVQLLAGSIDAIDADEEFDLAFLVQVAPYLDDGAVDVALRRILAALRSGGRLLLVSIVDDPGTPGFSANWTSAIEMLLSSPGISLRTTEELGASLARAGFRNIEAHEPWALSAGR